MEPRIPVSTIGSLTSVDQISNLIVGARQPAVASPAPGASAAPAVPAVPTPVKLSDIATVQLDDIATTGYARTNGNPALTLTVTKTSTANTVEVAQAVEKALNDAQAAHPGTLTVTVVQNLSDFIVESQDGLLREGGLGRPVRDRDHLPVPVQCSLDARRGDLDPAVCPQRARADAGRRDHAERNSPLAVLRSQSDESSTTPSSS